MFRHPKYYKELRKLRNNSDQVISHKDSTEARRRAPGPGLLKKVTSNKPQASSNKHQANED